MRIYTCYIQLIMRVILIKDPKIAAAILTPIFRTGIKYALI